MTDRATRPAVLCVGRLYCDLVFSGAPRLPTMGTEVFSDGLGLHAGGGAFITAAHFAWLGHATSLAAFLPNAPFDAVVRRDLARAGLRTTLCRPAAQGQDPQVTVAIVGHQDRAFLTRRTGLAAPGISPSDLIKDGIRHLHIGELATLVECPALLSVARAAGASVSLDCSWDETLPIDGVPDLLRQVDVFLPNEMEAQHLSDHGLPQLMAPLTVIKQGSAGAMALGEGVHERAPAPATKVIDTTGAGDAFNAGFLSAWLERLSIDACLSAGNRMGAKAVSGHGGFHLAPDDSDFAIADIGVAH